MCRNVFPPYKSKLSVPLMKLDSPNLIKQLNKHQNLSNENINSIINESDFNTKNESSLSSHDDSTLYGSIKSSIKHQVKLTENQQNLLLNYRTLENSFQTENTKINKQKIVCNLIHL